MKSIILVIALFFVTTSHAQWGAWGEDISSNTKNRNEALNMAQVIPGTVMGVRKVNVTPSQSSIATSSTVGAIAGYAIAGQIDNSDIARLAGGLGGGFLAQSITPTEQAHEILVSYFSPSRQKPWTIAITTKEHFAKGERVFIIQDSNGVRVARYN